MQKIDNFDRDEFDYVAFYCEENVLRLLERLDGAPSRRFAVFVSNADRRVPLFDMRASARTDGLVVWDYHVFALLVDGHGDDAQTRVLDFDCRSRFASSAREYAATVVRPQLVFNDTALQRQYRVVPVDELRRAFASDRSHMLAPDGQYQAPPPPWPAFEASEPPSTKNLFSHFVNMSAVEFGRVLDEDEFLELLLAPARSPLLQTAATESSSDS